MDARRRQLLSTLAALPALAGLPGSVSAAPGAPLYAYVGCRTTKERKARGKGITVYRVNRESGEWTQVQLVEGLDNPSFLAFDRTQRFLYSVHGDFSDVSAYAINPADGTLSLLNRQSTGGKNPVHLVADPSNRFMLVSNYATGSLASLPIRQDGSLDAVVDLVALPGEAGPHKTQQKSSHPHHMPFDRKERFIIVPDKGLDRVFTFRLDQQSGKLLPGEPSSVSTRSGAGPRHVDFHPSKPLAYVINELDSTITTYRYDPASGALAPVQIVPTLPGDFTGDNTGAEIVVAKSGRYLFGSNRGHDSIVTMAIDAGTGLLSPVAWTATQGKGPRFFTLDPSEKLLYAANENSDSIVAFRVDAANGGLRPTGRTIATGSPVCLVFLDARA